MTDIMWFAYSSGYVAVGCFMLVMAKKFFDLLTPYSLEVQLTTKDNTAVGVLLGGYLAGVAAVLCGVFIGDTAELTFAAFLSELGPAIGYGFLGIVLLFIAGIVNDKAILHSFSNTVEIITRRNTAVALVMGAGYLGSGIIIAAGIIACSGVLSAILSFVVAQAALVGFCMLYQKLTAYDDQKELGEEQNVAAGLGTAGSMIAYSMIVAKGLASREMEWSQLDNLLNLLYYAIGGCILLFVARFICDRLFLPKSAISVEIVKDRNLNAGILEAVLAISLGAILLCCL
ncbi:MAG: DUF350 domain-containing protein [Lentisphaeria bacterium]|nr:DUF350 domain-containing protein [Lentisphaeria bacterium]